jgi:putative ABC transport system permease protein
VSFARFGRAPCDRAELTADRPYAARNLLRSPGFAAVAILSRALGIAPLAVVGGFLNAMFVRPAPYVDEPDRLVAIFRGVGEPAARRVAPRFRVAPFGYD